MHTLTVLDVTSDPNMREGNIIGTLYNTSWVPETRELVVFRDIHGKKMIYRVVSRVWDMTTRVPRLYIDVDFYNVWG